MIMPKRGPWGSEYPVSRDWANDIPCKNKDCLLTGGGRCVSPANVSVGNTGRCEFYEKQCAKQKEDKNFNRHIELTIKGLLSR